MLLKGENIGLKESIESSYYTATSSQIVQGIICVQNVILFLRKNILNLVIKCPKTLTHLDAFTYCA